MPRPIRLAVMLASVLLTAASLHGPTGPRTVASGAGATSTGPPMARYLAGQPMTPCLVRGEIPVKAEVAGWCGTLQVPEDRSHPDGRRIPLRLAVIPALAQIPLPDPLFAIAGGPGDPSTQFFAWLPAHYAAVHATHDIVLVDQRGTGASNALTLPALPDATGLSASEADAHLAVWMRDQLAALDADPRFYTSTVAADDLDDVRAALGYDTIDLYGTSYGGTLAQYYLRQHPDHARVAVLDGATPLDVPVLERIAANSQGALDRLLERCAADASCHAAFPELAAEWSTLRGRLAMGITTDIVDPRTGEHAVADLLGVGPSLHDALLTASTAARLPLAIHLAFEGDWGQATALVPPAPSGGDRLIMADEILCSEAWARFDPTEVARAGDGSYALPMELARAQAQATMCRYLPSGVVPPDDASAVRTSMPILWLTADADPQDPPANLAAVSAQEPNARVVVMPAQDHVIGHLGCAPDVIAAFLDAGTASGLEASCIEHDSSALPFRIR